MYAAPTIFCDRHIFLSITGCSWVFCGLEFYTVTTHYIYYDFVIVIYLYLQYSHSESAQVDHFCNFVDFMYHCASRYTRGGGGGGAEGHCAQDFVQNNNLGRILTKFGQKSGKAGQDFCGWFLFACQNICLVIHW